MKYIYLLLTVLLVLGACTQPSSTNGVQNPINQTSENSEQPQQENSSVVTEAPANDIVAPEQTELDDLEHELSELVRQLGRWNEELAEGLDYDDFEEFVQRYESDREKFEELAQEIRSISNNQYLLDEVEDGEESIASIEEQIGEISDCAGLKQEFPQKCRITHVNAPDYKSTTHVDYKYESYDAYVDEGNQQLVALLKAEDINSAVYTNKYNNSVFYIARWSDSWGENHRLWSVEMNAETGELVRYREITNEDGSLSIDRSKLWWVPS